jgi:hypothetical protein
MEHAKEWLYKDRPPQDLMEITAVGSLFAFILAESGLISRAAYIMLLLSTAFHNCWLLGVFSKNTCAVFQWFFYPLNIYAGWIETSFTTLLSGNLSRTLFRNTLIHF